MQLAEEIVAKNPMAIVKAKKICNEANYASAEEGLLIESIEQETIKGTKNQIEAVMAAMQKRPANFDDYRE